MSQSPRPETAGATGATGTSGDAGNTPVETLLLGMVAHQEGKVLGLARRLRPGLTAEDIRNPHDFPDLDDADFNYEDGLLAGLQAALMAVRALQRDGRPGETDR